MALRKKKVVADNQRTLCLITRSKSFAYVEAYKALRTNLDYIAGSTEGAKVIMITSSMPSESKTNTAVNLSVSLAQAGKKVILLDCDLRKGMLHRYLRIPRQSAGISTLLAGEASLGEALHHFQDLQIDVLTAGYVPANPSELLGSPAMGNLLKTLAANYDYVICDTAPINVVSDAAALGRYADGAVLVVSHNLVTRESALAAKAALENANVHILGAVLTQYDAKKSGSKAYTYYNYNYGDGYGYGQTHRSKSGSEAKRPESSSGSSSAKRASSNSAPRRAK
jgi:capsular exopolysaccharide synthesis family protein